MPTSAGPELPAHPHRCWWDAALRLPGLLFPTTSLPEESWLRLQLDLARTQTLSLVKLARPAPSTRILRLGAAWVSRGALKPACPARAQPRRCPAGALRVDALPPLTPGLLRRWPCPPRPPRGPGGIKSRAAVGFLRGAACFTALGGVKS